MCVCDYISLQFSDGRVKLSTSRPTRESGNGPSLSSPSFCSFSFHNFRASPTPTSCSDLWWLLTGSQPQLTVILILSSPSPWKFPWPLPYLFCFLSPMPSSFVVCSFILVTWTISSSFLGKEARGFWGFAYLKRSFLYLHSYLIVWLGIYSILVRNCFPIEFWRHFFFCWILVSSIAVKRPTPFNFSVFGVWPILCLWKLEMPFVSSALGLCCNRGGCLASLTPSVLGGVRRCDFFDNHLLLNSLICLSGTPNSKIFDLLDDPLILLSFLIYFPSFFCTFGKISSTFSSSPLLSVILLLACFIISESFRNVFWMFLFLLTQHCVPSSWTK